MLELTQSIDGIDRGFYRLEHSFSGASEAIRIPAGPVFLSASIHPASGTARVEYTVSTLAAVQAGTARWLPWDLGDVVASKADALISAVTAIRGVASSSAVIEVCAR